MEPKDRILQKAHELFYRYGVRSVSVDDIVAPLGMSKKTLYQYYVDKEELVGAVFLTVMEQNRTNCLQDVMVADDAIHEIFLAFDRVQEMFATMNPSILFELEKYHPRVFNQFKKFKNEFLYNIIKANLERGIAEGFYRPEIDVDVLTRFRLHSIMLAFNAEVYFADPTKMVHIEQQLLEHFLYGVATAKGIKQIHKYKNQRDKKIQHA
jgi:TetR/AcrR family transcriptional regulator, cholesterol catabolism regulator